MTDNPKSVWKAQANLVLRFVTTSLLVLFTSGASSSSQQTPFCTAKVSQAKGLSDCLQKQTQARASASLLPGRIYDLESLIDLGEQYSPSRGESWARAKSSIERQREENARNLPQVSIAALAADARAISPFPKPLAPRGYVTVEVPLANAELRLDYALVDFSRRPSQHAAAHTAIDAVLSLGRVQQEIAYRIQAAFFDVQDSAGAVSAAEQNKKTAETLYQSSDEALRNGRSTLPDVENAKAGLAQARYQLAQADAQLKRSKVLLSETVGAEPTLDFEIETRDDNSEADYELGQTVESLIAEARRQRPDLMAALEETKARREETKRVRGTYLPSIGLRAAGGQTREWPHADYGDLGPANVSTWDAAVELKWNLVDFGKSHRLARATDALIESQEVDRRKDESVVRDVWDSYIDFTTAQEELLASRQFLVAAETSYNSSFEAYGYGVRSLVDVVQSEKALSDARYALVHSKTLLLKAAAKLSFAVGRSHNAFLPQGGATP